MSEKPANVTTTVTTTQTTTTTSLASISGSTGNGVRNSGSTLTPTAARHPYIVVAVHGFWSFVLFLLNLVSIVLVGTLTFWLKGVSRHAADSSMVIGERFRERQALLSELAVLRSMPGQAALPSSSSTKVGPRGTGHCGDSQGIAAHTIDPNDTATGARMNEPWSNATALI